MSRKTIAVCDTCGVESGLHNLEWIKINGAGYDLIPSIEVNVGDGKIKEINKNLDFCSIECLSIYLRKVLNGGEDSGQEQTTKL